MPNQKRTKSRWPASTRSATLPGPPSAQTSVLIPSGPAGQQYFQGRSATSRSDSRRTTGDGLLLYSYAGSARLGELAPERAQVPALLSVADSTESSGRMGLSPSNTWIPRLTPPTTAATDAAAHAAPRPRRRWRSPDGTFEGVVDECAPPSASRGRRSSESFVYRSVPPRRSRRPRSRHTGNGPPMRKRSPSVPSHDARVIEHLARGDPNPSAAPPEAGMTTAPSNQPCKAADCCLALTEPEAVLPQAWAGPRKRRPFRRPHVERSPREKVVKPSQRLRLPSRA